MSTFAKLEKLAFEALINACCPDNPENYKEEARIFANEFDAEFADELLKDIENGELEIGYNDDFYITETDWDDWY